MMRLRYTPIKGYVHTIEALINYGGLHDQIEPVRTDPFEPDDGLLDDNPLSSVPTLILDDGRSVYGGPLIYEYLDRVHDKAPLFRAEGWLDIRQLLWLADGLFDQWVRIARETVIDEDNRRPDFIARQWLKVERCLDELEEWVPKFSSMDIGQMRTIGTLAFLDRVYGPVSEKLGPDALDPGYEWRAARPALASWYEPFRSDPIFTTPLVPEEDAK